MDVKVLLLAAFVASTMSQCAWGVDINSVSVPVPCRIIRTINRDWTFHYFPDQAADQLGAQGSAFDDATWTAVAVPHTWSTYETTGKVHPFIYDASERNDSYWWYGWGWYRKHFRLDPSCAGRRVFLEFDGVQKYCKLWLNGHPIGDHKGGYTSFSFDVTPFIHLGDDADNVVAVAVNNRQDDPFSIPPMSAGNFNVYGGIYRDVRLVVTDSLHLPFQGSADHQGGTFVTTPSVSDNSATVRVRTWIRNDRSGAVRARLVTCIFDADGKLVQQASKDRDIRSGDTADFDQMIDPLKVPHLWSPQDPYLYRVQSNVFDGDTLVDQMESPIGIRTYKWDYASNRLVLNGKAVIIRGTNRHQEWPWLGDATPKWLQLQDMRDIRTNLNDNFMRTAHYPNDPAIYDFCDRNGIIVIEEMPNIKRQLFSPEVQVQQLREAIRRDRNHPSIFFWDMGNETDHAVDSKYAIEEDTTRLIHARKVSNDSAGKFVNTTEDNIALESLLRCTIRGWYDSDVRDLQPASVQQTGTEEWQHDQAVKAIQKLNEGRTSADRANINTWLYEDHGCNRQYIGSPLDYVNPKGWVDCWRTPKYMYYLWQAFYAEKPMVFVHPHVWRRQYIGQRKEIVVDSNCEEVELKAGGRSLGVARPTFESVNVVRFAGVTVQDVTLTAEGRQGGRVVATMQLPMAGSPAKLAAAAEPATLEAALDSVAIVRADVLDGDGHHVYGATNTLQWSVLGPATLVGAVTYTSDISKNEANQGTMYIDAPAFNIIRSTGAPGEIRVRVRSPGLAPAEVIVIATPIPAEPANAMIRQPRLSLAGRMPAQSQPTTMPARHSTFAQSPQELPTISDDLTFHAASIDEYGRQIDAFLHAHNPGLDFKSPAYAALVQSFARLAAHNKGLIVRDDFNFTAKAFNDVRGLARAVATLSVPQAFKQSLDDYYARTLIVDGQAPDMDAEINWLRALPAGTIVMTDPKGVAPHEVGLLYARSTDLSAIVEAATPEFKSLNADGQAATLEAMAAINRNIRRRVIKVDPGKVGGVQQKVRLEVTYVVPAGEPILVPEIGYLRQQHLKGTPSKEGSGSGWIPGN